MNRTLIGKIGLCSFSFFLSITTDFAQTPAQRPSFEVASIKRNVSGSAVSPVPANALPEPSGVLPRARCNPAFCGFAH